MVSIEVQGAPSFYKCHEGVLDELENHLLSRKIKSALVVHGTQSFLAIQEFWPELTEVQMFYEPYCGECSESEIKRLESLAAKLCVDALIGIGGGKVLDLIKAVGHEISKDVILIPTLASTCSAWTPLSVIYDDEGRFVTYTIFPRSTYMVLVEPRVIVKAPLAYLRAGIGDTLAKWFEARALTFNLEYTPLTLEVALSTAKLSRDRLLEYSQQAIEDCQNEELTPAVKTIIEANIMLGGMVGGFGDRFGRIAGAHSIHNGLTHIANTHHLLHGEKVAYGILVQLALEHEWEEIEGLLPFYKDVGLPTSLADLHITNQKEIEIIAEKALLKTESIHFMKHAFSKEDILKSIEKLEQLTKI